MKKIIVSPSILTADFLNLKDDLNKFKENGIEWIHYDVMDYHFVPNLSFGPEIMKQIKKGFTFKIDAHLMIETNKPLNEYLEPFINAGADQITMHYEALNEDQIEDFFNICDKVNVKKSLAVNPNTAVDVLTKYLERLDNILVMSVNPGFGGQKFIDDVIKKVLFLNDERDNNNYKYTIEIDGGINSTTISKLNDTGIDMIVAGSFLFDTNELKERIEMIKNVK